MLERQRKVSSGLSAAKLSVEKRAAEKRPPASVDVSTSRSRDSRSKGR